MTDPHQEAGRAGRRRPIRMVCLMACLASLAGAGNSLLLWRLGSGLAQSISAAGGLVPAMVSGWILFAGPGSLASFLWPRRRRWALGWVVASGLYGGALASLAATTLGVDQGREVVFAFGHAVFVAALGAGGLGLGVLARSVASAGGPEPSGP